MGAKQLKSQIEAYILNFRLMAPNSPLITMKAAFSKKIETHTHTLVIQTVGRREQRLLTRLWYGGL